MRCNIVDVPITVGFGQLLQGTVFRVEGFSNTYMKTAPTQNYNCVVLDNGNLSHFQSDRLVIPRNDVVLVKE
jgi:hypothetical protein